MIFPFFRTRSSVYCDVKKLMTFFADLLTIALPMSLVGIGNMSCLPSTKPTSVRHDYRGLWPRWHPGRYPNSWRIPIYEFSNAIKSYAEGQDCYPDVPTGHKMSLISLTMLVKEFLSFTSPSICQEGCPVCRFDKWIPVFLFHAKRLERKSFAKTSYRDYRNEN